MPAGSVCDVEVSGTEEVISLSGVLFGDVWLCSGQSNMEQSMANIMNATIEIANSAPYTNIRYMEVANSHSLESDDDVDVSLSIPWSDSSAATLKDMSAICYLFARNIQDMMQAEGDDPVPLGMVDSDWGGTPIESWSSQETLDVCDARAECTEEYPQRCDSRLWNAMINPLKRNAVKGFLWYQGESNGGVHRDIYNCTFPALIDSWRQEFSANSATAEDALFGFVQLAQWRPNQLANGIPVIRWHQTVDQGFVPNEQMSNVFMASSLDTYDPKQEGYPGGIHSRYKQIVAERLAVAGMNVAYGYTAPYIPTGPFPSSAVLDPQTMQLTITYDTTFSYNNQEISGFYVCTQRADLCDAIGNVALWAEIEKASVAQKDDRTITIDLDSYAGQNVLSVSYAWRETPVTEYLGLPIYGNQGFLLPSPPWKKTILMN
eukprot:TRINITY_DN57430_c0_g1_i1.p1 TRINITY_DN57430_c0_g1~~TRINITY_DN57430_c0_g1_i1.p1  ORF type:complete len:486 (+),score=94.70 TRINITY_DN57430_c0_g1_i1:160-1458(+)